MWWNGKGTQKRKVKERACSDAWIASAADLCVDRKQEKWQLPEKQLPFLLFLFLMRGEIVSK